MSPFRTLFISADFDGDYDVDDDDLYWITDHAGMTGATWWDGDLNGDAAITQADLDIALAEYGRSGLFLSVVG